MTANIDNWKEEAKRLISKVCCDGQFVEQAISFISKIRKESYRRGYADGKVSEIEASVPTQIKIFKETRENIRKQARAEAFKEIGEMVEGMRGTPHGNEDERHEWANRAHNALIAALQSKLKEKK